MGVHPVRGLVGVADESAVDQGRLSAGQQEQVGAGKGRCCQVTQDRNRPGSLTTCSASARYASDVRLTSLPGGP